MILSTKRVVAVVGATAALATLGATTSTYADAATIPSVLTKIRYCESGNNYASKASSGTAGGAYGFLDSTWRASTVAATKNYAHAWLAPASVQDAAAIALYNQLGTKPWVASQSCWSKLTTVPTTTTGSTGTSNTSTGTASTNTSTAKKPVNSTRPKPAGTPPKGAPPQGACPTGTPPKGAPHGKPPTGAPKGAAPHGAPHGKPPVKSS